MKPISIRRWLAAAVLGSTMAAGCRHAESSPAPPLAMAAPHLPTVTTVKAEEPAASPATTVAAVLPDSEGAAREPIASALPPMPPADLIPSLEEIRRRGPEVIRVAEAKPAPGQSSDGTGVKFVQFEKPEVSSEVSAPLAPVAASAPAPHAENPVPRRAFVDISAQPCFNHSEDYSTLSGRLEHFGRSWRLRFASVDEVDPYGGSVTLVQDTRLGEHHDGEYVQVQGHLLDGEARRSAPSYQIDSIQVIEHQGQPASQP
jgi:hypothetical protein